MNPELQKTTNSSFLIYFSKEGGSNSHKMYVLRIVDLLGDDSLSFGLLAQVLDYKSRINTMKIPYINIFCIKALLYY